VPADSSFPFVAAVFPSSTGPLDTFCGGTLVARYWVVTAAHCVYGLSAGQIQVALGKRNLATIGASARRTVDRIIVHSYYSGPAFHDIALLRLAQPVPTSVASPLPLIPDRRYAYRNAPAWVLGWGLMSNPPSSNYAYTLRLGAMHIFAGSAESTCGSWTSANGFYYTLALCAGEPYPTGGSVASCSGDSGGPLYIKLSNNKRYLAGIVAAAYQVDPNPVQCSNAPPGYVPIYTRVSTYVNWIKAWVNTRR
jgi:trypsin